MDSILFIVSTYLASTYCYLRSRIFNNKKKRRLILNAYDKSANDKDIHLCTSRCAFGKGNCYHALEKCEGVLDEIINQVCLAKEDVCENASDVTASHANEIDATANDTSGTAATNANIYEIDVNMENSWSLEYGIDHVKIYHCHIPIMSIDSDNDYDDF